MWNGWQATIAVNHNARGQENMRQVVRSTLFLAAAVALAACYDSESTTYPTQKLKVSADRAGAMIGFGFQSGGITGFGPGIVSLTGGGSFDPSTATNAESDETVGHGNGGF